MEPLNHLADALHAAHWPSLVPVLGALTGEPERFAGLLPPKLDVLDEQGGMSPRSSEPPTTRRATS